MDMRGSSIDASKAEALSGVKAIVLGKDLVQNYEDKVSDLGEGSVDLDS